MTIDIKVIAGSIATLCIFFIMATFLKQVIMKLGTQDVQPSNVRKEIDHVNIMSSQIAYFVFYIMIFIGFSFVLPHFGVQRETLFALLGSVAIAIGISLQGALSNMWCGMIIMMNGIYNVGDVIKFSSKLSPDVITGRITSMNLFYTKLADINTGAEISVANNIIYTSGISTNNTISYTGLPTTPSRSPL